MNELLRFKKNAMRLGLCDEYKAKWDACKSFEDLMDIALDANGVEFLADSVSFGWGMAPASLANDFHDFINGRYQREKDGYTSELYVNHASPITLRSTITLAIGCDMEVKLPATFVGTLYVTGGSNVRVMPLLDAHHGSWEVITYGDAKVYIPPVPPVADFSFHVEEVKESKWLNGKPLTAH